MRNLFMAAAAASMVVPVMPAPAFAHDGYRGKVWKDSKGRYRCKRPDGTVGLIVGGAAGALVGRAVDTKGERATGTILGAAAGALLGRSVDRNRTRCR
ncbi:MAG TPA: glycine zipper 2TM domain-containing protein [Sphingomicrobium sp.]|nr:glycine zipper 2TM domain-containing protein [Sphingomicrobium sp.]